MPSQLVFSHPEPPHDKSRIWPVFLPFAGCPYRCIYCAQDRQTGEEEAELADKLAELDTELEKALDRGRGPYELAFYGGTFTALPDPWPMAFLAVAQRYKERGLVTRVRCSTRPDCVDEAGLDMYQALGLDMVELGVQSFDDIVLKESGRGYTGETAKKACELVTNSGLGLGIQLLPGLPGDRENVFLDDAKITAALKPEVARIYPCLVIRDTPLATLWERGDYVPWELDRARKELAVALPILWGQSINVIRLGLPPEGTLAEHILAGPWHPALGQSVRGLALLDVIKEKLNELDGAPKLLEVPRRYQGELMGHAKELAAQYEKSGITRANIRYTEEDEFRLN